MKPKQTRLIVEFKKFQRLPDWPLTKLSDPNRVLETAGEKQITVSVPRTEAKFPTQTFAE